MIIKRKTITRRGGAAGGVDGGGVKSVAVGDSTYQPDADGQVALPNLVQAVKINSTTHAPNSSGTVDLGNVGGGGTVNSVSANGTTYQPDANGDVDVGDMVKLLSFLGTNYSPDSDGKITIANIAGYYASNLNGLNLYGTTQRPLSYDSTTQYLEYSMSPSTSTVSLRLLRTSGMNTQNIAYFIEFRATCHVVSSTSSTARIEGYVEVDAMGVPSGVTWAIGLARVNDASRPIFFALDGFTDAPNYWTTNDAALRQVGFSPTGYQVEAYNRDADKFSAKALATSGQLLVNGKRRYYYDLSFDMTGTSYTENAFTDISREASGALSVTLNGVNHTPNAAGLVDLGTTSTPELNVLSQGSFIPTRSIATMSDTTLSIICVKNINVNSPTYSRTYQCYSDVIVTIESGTMYAKIHLDTTSYEVFGNTTAIKYISILDDYTYLPNKRVVAEDMRMWILVIWDDNVLTSEIGADPYSSFGVRCASSAPRMIYPAVSRDYIDSYNLGALCQEVASQIDSSVLADSFAAVTGYRDAGLLGHYCHSLQSIV